MNSSGTLQARKRRALFRASHRGTKEMDLVLGPFAGVAVADMTLAELERFERFLEMPDPELSDWVTNGVFTGAPEFEPLFLALRRFHGLTAE